MSQEKEVGCPRKKRRIAVRELVDEAPVKPTVKVIDGLRYVVPYRFLFKSYAKKRWFGRSILEVFTAEFQAYPADYYRRALESGRITVNAERADPSHVLQDHDFIAHALHRHEPPVLDRTIEIITEDKEVLVVNKPPSIPIHTTGRFHHNTLLKMLEGRVGYKLYTCHRLDRLTSGIIVLLKNPSKARTYADLFAQHKVQKSYLALCAGKFPPTVACSEPILRVCHKLGICSVDRENGKPAHTDFTLLHYCPTTDRSLVLCSPRSGRMHQIRVHLAHLGHPIPNDPIYSRENWARKSTAEFSAELSRALFASDDVTPAVRDVTTDKITCGNDVTTDKTTCGNEVTSDKTPAVAEVTSDKKPTKPTAAVAPERVSGDGVKTAAHVTVDPTGRFVLDGRVYEPIPALASDPECPECRVTRLVPHPEDMLIYLHAVRYELAGAVYTAPLPEWCEEGWVPADQRAFLGLEGSSKDP